MAASFKAITSSCEGATTATPLKGFSKCLFPVYLALPEIHKKSTLPVPTLFELGHSHLFERFGIMLNYLRTQLYTAIAKAPLQLPSAFQLTSDGRFA